MKYLINLISSLIILNLNAQNKIILLDASDLSPIANAVISFSNCQTISDENGRFNKSKFYSKKVTISHISYQSKSVLLKQGLDTILLNRKEYSIPEIEVSTEKKEQFYELGYYRSKKGLILYNCILAHRNSIIATFIPSDSQNSLIEGIYFSKRKKEKESEFVIYLFTVNEKGLPGDTIFSKYVLQKELDRKEFLNIREEKLSIPPNGLFIGFKLIKSYDESVETLQVNATNEGSYGTTYMIMNRKGSSWIFVGLPEEPGNARFGLKMKRLD